MKKHPYAGPLWKDWGTVTIGMSTVGPVAGPNIDVEFAYVANVNDSIGYVRVAATNQGDGSATFASTSVTFGPKISEYGSYFPVLNLSCLRMSGQTGAESVTIVYGLPSA